MGVRPRGGLAAGDPRRRARVGRAAAGDRPAEEAGRRTRPLGRPPRPRARRPGLRPGEDGADERSSRHQPAGAVRLRRRGSRLRQLGDPRDRRLRRAEGALAGAAAGRRDDLGLLDDRARERRLRPDAAEDPRRPRRRRVGHRRPQVVLLERLDRRLPDPDGGHRPRCAAARPRLDVRRSHRHPRRRHRARRGDDGAPEPPSWAKYGNHAEIYYRDVRLPAEALLGGRRRGLQDRPAAALPRPHPPLHALARGLPARLRHALRALAEPRIRTARCWPTSRRYRTGSRTRRRRWRRPD